MDFSQPERLMGRISLSMTLLHALTMHGNLLLALRHPQNTGKSRLLAEEAVAALSRLLLHAGVVSEADLQRVFAVEGDEHGMSWASLEEASLRIDATAARLGQRQPDDPALQYVGLSEAERDVLLLGLVHVGPAELDVERVGVDSAEVVNVGRLAERLMELFPPAEGLTPES